MLASKAGREVQKGETGELVVGNVQGKRVVYTIKLKPNHKNFNYVF